MKKLARLFVFLAAFLGAPDTHAVPPGSLFSATHVTADGIATGTTRLSTMSVTGLPSFATRAWVKSVGDWFVLGPAVGSAQAGVVVTALDGRQFVRQGVPNRTYLAALFWAIDPVNGSDEAQGWGVSQAAAELVPLKTLAELDRRLAGNPGFSGLIKFSIMGDIPLSDARIVQNIVQCPSPPGFPFFTGKRSNAITTGTVSGYVPKNVGAGTGATYLMNLTSAASYIGKMIEDQDRRYTFVLAADSANVARISTPMVEKFGAVTDGVGAEPGDMVNGKTFGIYDLYKLPSWPYSSQITFGLINNLALGGGITNNLIGPNLGLSTVWVQKCMVEGSTGGNGTSGEYYGGFTFWGGCFFRNGGSGGVSFLHHAGNFHCPVFLNVTASFMNGSASAFQEEAMLYNSNIFMDETSSIGGIVNSTPRLQFGVFNTAGKAISGGRLRLPSDGGTFYGANNTGTILAVPQGAAYSIPKAGSTATTSGSQITVGGTPKLWSDVPFVNTANNASISDGY